MNWYYWKKIGLDIPRFWKESGSVFIIPIVMTVVFMAAGFWINWYNIWALVIGIVVYTVVFFVLSWFFVMNDYEKELLLSPLKNIYFQLKQKR